MTRLTLILFTAIALANCASDHERETRIVYVDEVAAGEALAGALAQGLVRFEADGEIVPALASRWHVSDDGLSYIFRLDDVRWADGSPVEAQKVARLLLDRIDHADNRLADTLGAVEEVRAMTDRVIEIRLTAPRPHLLQLLAQPAFLIADPDGGTGPFALLEADSDSPGATMIGRLVESADGRGEVEERVRIETDSAADAVQRFVAGEVDLVTGGRFDSLPLAQQATGMFGTPRFDPVSGLFGLLPISDTQLLADGAVRQVLNAAIDRDALVAALDVDGLLPRATLLQRGLDLETMPAAPGWVDQPIDERREDARAFLEEQEFEDSALLVGLPEGPGGDLLFTRLAADWGAIGLVVERAASPGDADLILVDAVAPATSAAWFLRKFRCELRTHCSPEADVMLDEARAATGLAERQRLLGEAASLMQELALFMPISAPVRWSLVSPDLPGFAENRFAIHFPGALRQAAGASR